MMIKPTSLLIATTLLTALASALWPNSATARTAFSGGCPPEHPEAREMVVAFIEAPAFSQDAAALGFAPADTSGLRLLTMPADSAACAQLQSGLDAGDVAGYPHLNSFYEARGYYFIGTGVDPSAGTSVNANGTIKIRIERSYVTVLDSTFQVVGAYTL